MLYLTPLVCRRNVQLFDDWRRLNVSAEHFERTRDIEYDVTPHKSANSKVGEMLREETSGQNPYAMQFDMGGMNSQNTSWAHPLTHSAMDNLLNLLQTIKSSKESDLNAWRPHVDNEASVESKIVSLIQKLKKAHSQENGGTSHIISMIQKIESEYLNQGV